MGSFFKKYWWLLLIIIFVLFGIVLWLLFADSEKIVDKPVSTTTVTSSSKSSTSSSKKAEMENDEDLLKKAVSEQLGISLEKLNVETTDNTGKYAKGLVNVKGGMSGGYWLAYKDKEQWYLVYDGQETPQCAQVNLRSFPADMVSKCLDTSGNVVTRT